MWTWKHRLSLVGGILGAVAALPAVVRSDESRPVIVVIDIAIGAAALGVIGLAIGAVIDAVRPGTRGVETARYEGVRTSPPPTPQAERSLPNDTSEVRYSTVEWTTADVRVIQQALTDRGITFRMEGGELMVPRETERYVDAIVTEIMG